MTQDQLKQAVAQAAMDLIRPQLDQKSVIGVGTGSTVNKFIDALGEALKADPQRVAGAVSSSVRSTQRLEALGIQVLPAESVISLGVYIDGADEIDHAGHMIKGGGAALTREKIVADLAEQFVCIADESKLVDALGKFPLPVEVIPMAAAQVIRAFAKLGGTGKVREGVTTDNNQIPGVVTVGVFARNKAGVCLLGTSQGVKTLTF